MASMPEVEIFTDGACSGNPGPGGWGTILRSRGVEKELSGGEPATTNNRMELMAAIAGLEALKRPCRVRLYTDSQYLRDGITQWLPAWKARGWRTASKAAVKNVDLWQRLEPAAAPHGNPPAVAHRICAWHTLGRGRRTWHVLARSRRRGARRCDLPNPPSGAGSRPEPIRSAR